MQAHHNFSDWVDDAKDLGHPFKSFRDGRGYDGPFTIALLDRAKEIYPRPRHLFPGPHYHRSGGYYHSVYGKVYEPGHFTVERYFPSYKPESVLKFK